MGTPLWLQLFVVDHRHLGSATRSHQIVPSKTWPHMTARLVDSVIGGRNASRKMPV